MVTTFEITGGEFHQVGTADSMSTASAQLPPGAYTTFRTYWSERVLRLEQHIRRLIESAELLGMTGGLNSSLVRVSLGRVLRETDYKESRFRLTFAPPRLFATVEAFTPYPVSYYENGVSCITVTQHRDNPHAKSTGFIASAGDAYKALPAGIHEGVMVSTDGYVLEGLSSNFFAVLDGILRTEQAQALLGVTQALALEVARVIAPAVSQSPYAIRLVDLPRTAECFITSVSREVMPVVEVDGVVIGDGVPGPLTRALMRGLADLIEREAQSVFT